jgi:hypothetical protein
MTCSENDKVNKSGKIKMGGLESLAEIWKPIFL